MCPPCQTRIIRTMVEPAVLFLSGQNARKNRKANKKRRDANFILRPAVFIPLYKVRKIAFAENHPSGNSSVGYAATFHAMEGKLFNDGIHNTIAIVYLLLNRQFQTRQRQSPNNGREAISAIKDESACINPEKAKLSDLILFTLPSTFRRLPP